MSDSVFAVVVTHRRPDELAKSLDVLSTQTRLPDHLIVVDNDGARMVPTAGFVIWLPANQYPQLTWVHAEISAGQAVSHSGCCTPWHRALIGYG